MNGSSAGASGRNTVLVVEDMDEVRRALAKMVQMQGFDVLQARDGSEAIHVFGEHAAKIVAVTLDLMMPTTDGRETLSMLSSFAPGVAIVLSSALPQPDNLLGRGPGSRGVAYLQKPYSAEELGAALRRVIAEMRDIG
jgi:two-component system cell cycle sensor histidine kinase/response regulator CckA